MRFGQEIEYIPNGVKPDMQAGDLPGLVEAALVGHLTLERVLAAVDSHDATEAIVRPCVVLLYLQFLQRRPQNVGGGSATIGALQGAPSIFIDTDTEDFYIALRVPEDWARGTIRFSVGRMTTADQIDEVVRVFSAAVSKQAAQH